MASANTTLRTFAATAGTLRRPSPMSLRSESLRASATERCHHPDGTPRPTLWRAPIQRSGLLRPPLGLYGDHHRCRSDLSHCERARQNGAIILTEPQDQPYGERQYNAQDFCGHRWDFTETITDVAPI